MSEKDIQEQILEQLKLLNTKMDRLIIEQKASGMGNNQGMFPVNHVGPGAMPAMTGDPAAMAAIAGAGRGDNIRKEIQKRMEEARKAADKEMEKAKQMAASAESIPTS